MNRLGLYLVIGCVGLVAQTVRANGQAPDTGVALLHGQGPDMDELTLQDKYHIAATEEGLIGALRHEERSVRAFAALKLAASGDRTAIRPILDALAAETLQSDKIGLAVSAARLGSEEGFNALRNMCEDRIVMPVLRMSAAQAMISLGREECLSDIIEVLQSQPEDRQAVFGALNLLMYNRFKHIPPDQIDEIRNLCATYLKNPASELRTEAGMCIRDQGGPWAISQLRAAVDAEQDEIVRRSLAKDLVSVGR